MKKEKSLSDLIKKANQSKPDHSVGEVKSLLDSGKKSDLQHNRSYRPRRINKMFNPLNLIVMTLLIALLTTVLLMNPLNDKGTDGTLSEEFQVSGSTFQVEEQQELPNADQNTTEKPNPLNPLNPLNPVNPPNPLNPPNPPNPPIDTTINGAIFELSKEQLSMLGFLFEDEGYYYLNKLPDGSRLNFWSRYTKNQGGDFGFGKGGWINQNNKQNPSQFDFYPVAITDISGKPIRQVIRKETDVISASEFEEINDELVPVVFRYKDVGGYKKQDIVVWFKPSQEFLAVLKKMDIADQQIIEITENILNENKKVQFDYNYDIGIESIEGLKLDRKTLECLGFSFTDSTVDYKYEHKGDWITFFFYPSGVGHNSTSLSKFKNLQDSLKLIESPPLLCGVTDYLGKYHLTFSSPFDDTNENGGGDFIDYSVPIHMVEIDDFQNIEKSVFWFYPNERFFNCLPDSIGDPMRKEFNYHKKESGLVAEIIIEDFVPTKKAEDSEEVSCEYFPSFCEGLPGLDKLNVYPNPSSNRINIEVLISRGKSIDFRIFDLSGRVLIDDLPTKTYQKEGKFKEEMDISSLNPGLYLLVLTDNEGARMTKRIVKN